MAKAWKHGVLATGLLCFEAMSQLCLRTATGSHGPALIQTTFSCSPIGAEQLIMSGSRFLRSPLAGLSLEFAPVRRGGGGGVRGDGIKFMLLLRALRIKSPRSTPNAQ